MKKSSSAPPPPKRVQTGVSSRIDQGAPSSPQLFDILRWVADGGDKKLADIQDENLFLESKCAKQEAREMNLYIELSQLQTINDSTSAAQKKQRAEFVEEKKRMREKEEERINTDKDEMARYKQTTTWKLIEVRAEKDRLVNNVEVLDKMIIQSDLSNTELKRQRDELMAVRRTLEAKVDDLRNIISNTKDEREKDEESWTKEKASWVVEENRYLLQIRNLDTEKHCLDKHNYELAKMAKAHNRAWNTTLQRQNSERSEKRGRISCQTEMGSIDSPPLRDQSPNPFRPSLSMALEERPRSSNSQYSLSSATSAATYGSCLAFKKQQIW
ncbi:uncharacterized protein RAG0_11935 [Rhynchosporium agropyri]|uniref:Uncharacterized protein n=1 Tax=Rhynchosporium agropyri TaxID=914238 RepID=A0A1E1L6D4_9HELO|nr:uncharacterized protein RAG0_11935 [Rhynchosporium agropyri]